MVIDQLDKALQEEADLHRKESQRLNEELYLQASGCSGGPPGGGVRMAAHWVEKRVRKGAGVGHGWDVMARCARPLWDMALLGCSHCSHWARAAARSCRVLDSGKARVQLAR